MMCVWVCVRINLNTINIKLYTIEWENIYTNNIYKYSTKEIMTIVKYV